MGWIARFFAAKLAASAADEISRLQAENARLERDNTNLAHQLVDPTTAQGRMTLAEVEAEEVRKDLTYYIDLACNRAEELRQRDIDLLNLRQTLETRDVDLAGIRRELSVATDRADRAIRRARELELANEPNEALRRNQRGWRRLIAFAAILAFILLAGMIVRPLLIGHPAVPVLQDQLQKADHEISALKAEVGQLRQAEIQSAVREALAGQEKKEGANPSPSEYRFLCEMTALAKELRK